MNLSLCCISNILAEQGHKFRTMTFKSFSSKDRSESLEKLSGIVINNFNTSEKIVRHCAASGIKGYRLSSDLCPVIKHPEVMLGLEDLPNYSDIEESIKDLSAAIKALCKTMNSTTVSTLTINAARKTTFRFSSKGLSVSSIDSPTTKFKP